MRNKQEVATVWAGLLPRFAGSSTTLQGQVKEMMVHSILMGLIPAGAQIPPSRTLAAALGLSRNTVALALQALVDKGFLVSVERSGLFVNRAILLGQAEAPADGAVPVADIDWGARLKTRLDQQRNIVKPANWQEFRYPFVYGQFDQSLMPLREWRDCANQSMQAAVVRRWSQDFIDRDYEALLDQIQYRLLPARGIVVRREEILVTAGAQMSCFLLANFLLDPDTPVGIEDPGYPDARNNFRLRSERVLALPIDEHGLLPSERMAGCDYVYVTPSHQCPTTVTMPLQRRDEILRLARERDVVLFEDDHESELNFSGKPLPALKSLDTEGRVIYLGSLSKTLAHGLRIGYIVAQPRLIQELRALRRLIMRHPPSNNAHIASLFIAQGHHETFLRRLNTVYRERREQLVGAFADLLPGFGITPSQGGSGAWVTGPQGLVSRDLASACARAGVLIEPGDIFFQSPTGADERCFRLGYSAIAAPLIRSGVEAIRNAWLGLPQA